jgi:hypothetical protein
MGSSAVSITTVGALVFPFRYRQHPEYPVLIYPKVEMQRGRQRGREKGEEKRRERIGAIRGAG